MQYPATAHLLVKTAIIAKRIHKLCFHWLPEQAKKITEIDLKKMKGIAKEYYFIKRKQMKRISVSDDMKIPALKKLWSHIFETTMPIVHLAQLLTEPFILKSLPTRSKNLIDHFTRKAPMLLDGLFDRCFENLPRKIKIYSYCRDDVHCFNKMKHHKVCEFGRQFQIGRLQGNFIWSTPNTSVLMPDAASVKPMLREHLQLFQTLPQSIATDKAYYSKDNEQFLLSLGVESVGLLRSNRKYNDAPDNPITIERQQELADRRSGIEPLIGHLKRYWQMGRSRMKSDRTTESSGFCAMLGFNMRQMMRYLNGEATVITT
jgi:hypothetical protein